MKLLSRSLKKMRVEFLLSTALALSATFALQNANAAPEAKTAHEAASSTDLKPLPARKTASVKGALKMSDKELRAAVLKMSYCTLMIDGTAYYNLKFHSNGKLGIRNASSSSGDAYSSSGAYDQGAYNNPMADKDAYSGSSKKSATGSWSAKEGRLIVKFPESGEQVVYLTKSSVSKHQCF